jgi:hypothetical protein
MSESGASVEGNKPESFERGQVGIMIRVLWATEV